MTCIFCKIIQKEIPASIVFENENVLAFKDISPKAKTHLLFIPKQHIERLDDINNENEEIIAQLYSAIIEFAKKNDFIESGYQCKIHVGAGGGQEVFHLHIHFLSQKALNG
tara:strand:+ start:2040 stop:2372 length:333 start_codon:yes stop_codon:yes gene_type:complete